MEPCGSPEEVGSGISVQTVSFVCPDDIRLTGQIWRTLQNIDADGDEASRIRILCLHGFLDNCRSFAALAPRLLRPLQKQNHPVELVAMDFPGHGKSSHKSADHPPYTMISDILIYVGRIVEQLKWKTFILIGHSMGAMASILYTGTFPEHVQHLVLLDGFGPDFERASQVVPRLREHVIKRFEGNDNHGIKQKKSYRTLADATRTRQQTAVKSPGNQWLSEEGAEEMVQWAVDKVPGGWQFRHDPRLYWPALQSHTLEQAFDFWTSIRNGKVPTLWLRARDGWPFSTKWLDRAEAFLGDIGTTIRLPGSHHFHLDPDTVDSVATCILKHVFQKAHAK